MKPKLKPSPDNAFTMIEIAISLAVIGFALVAIIGILPLGMNVQRENREETIINQDAIVLMNAIRSGAQGIDDLTNYVMDITVNTTEYDRARQLVQSNSVTYTRTNSSAAPQFPLTSGFRIVGLLSTPKYIPRAQTGGFLSNRVAATVRAISGAASEKFPQTNQIVQDLGLTYRLISEVVNYASPVSGSVTNNAWDPNWVNFNAFPTNSPEYASRLTYYMCATNLQNNLHDVRLLFRWPLLPNGNLGNSGRQAFRAMSSGFILVTNDFRVPGSPPLYFFQSTTYTTNSL